MGERTPGNSTALAAWNSRQRCCTYLRQVGITEADAKQLVGQDLLKRLVHVFLQPVCTAGDIAGLISQELRFPSNMATHPWPHTHLNDDGHACSQHRLHNADAPAYR